MTNKYRKAYTEVLEILSHLSEEEYNKIPEEKISFYKQNMDINYIYKINPKIDLAEQYISEEANSVLVSLFRDYIATEKQKEILEKLLNQNQEKLEEAKREKYSVDKIFSKDTLNVADNNVEYDETRMIEYKESFFSKFVKKFLNWKA